MPVKLYTKNKKQIQLTERNNKTLTGANGEIGSCFKRPYFQGNDLWRKQTSIKPLLH